MNKFLEYTLTRPETEQEEREDHYPGELRAFFLAVRDMIGEEDSKNDCCSVAMSLEKRLGNINIPERVPWPGVMGTKSTTKERQTKCLVPVRKTMK